MHFQFVYFFLSAIPYSINFEPCYIIILKLVGTWIELLQLMTFHRLKIVN